MPKEILRCNNCRFCKYNNEFANVRRFYCALYDMYYDVNPDDVTCNNHSHYFGKIEMPRYIYKSE